MGMALQQLTVYDVVRQEVGDIGYQEAMEIAWNETGFPHFWNIPEDGATPVECFRKQLREFARAPHQERGSEPNASD